MARLILGVDKEGRTLVPLTLYFNEKGLVKMLLGLAKGRREIDKRDVEKKRDWDREKGRLLRDRG
jgi:SsrA-binding protein